MGLKLRDREIVGETIVLDDSAQTHVLGPSLTLRDCIVRVEGSGGRLFNAIAPVMIGGRWEQARQLGDYQFEGARFEGVAFTGAYLGCDFGDWDTPDLLVDCDFTGAALHQCRFLSIEPDTVTLPAWPGFAVIDPHRAVEAARAIAWPGSSRWALDLAEDTPCRIVAMDADALGKRRGTDAATLRPLLETLPGIRITG